MQSNLLNKRNLTIGAVALLVLVGVVLILWYMMPADQRVGPVLMQESPEMTAESFEEMGQEMAQEEQVGDRNKPYVDAETGALLDGPGFEKGDVDGVSQEVRENIPSNYYFLDDGAGGEQSIQHNLCSKSCCSEQWPTPFKQKFDPYVCGAKGKFSKSNIFCSNTFQDAGCLCLTKPQHSFLYSRGSNGRTWF